MQEQLPREGIKINSFFLICFVFLKREKGLEKENFLISPHQPSPFGEGLKQAYCIISIG